MVHLTGERLPIEGDSDTLQARAQRMRAARDALVRATGQDYGYDVSRWHKYLNSSQTSEEIYDEYTWGNLHNRFENWKPDPNWHSTVSEAERLALESPNCPQCGSFASLRKVSHGSPDAKEVMWLCNVCQKRLPITLTDNGSVNHSNDA